MVQSATLNTISFLRRVTSHFPTRFSIVPLSMTMRYNLHVDLSEYLGL